MANYSAAKSVHKTLTATTEDVVTLTSPASEVTVVNRTSGTDLFFTVNGAAVTVGADNSEVVPGGASVTVGLPPVSSPIINTGAPIAAQSFLRAPVAAGATVLTVDNGTAFFGMSTLFIGTGANREQKAISSVGIQSVVLSSGLSNAHIAGEQVDSGYNTTANSAQPPTAPVIRLISSGTPAYSVIGR